MAPRKPASTSATTTPQKTPIIQHQPETRVRVILEIPQSLFAIYEEQGIKSERMPEDEMLQRLHRCREHTALKPLYFNDDLRRKLEEALEHNISSPEVALAQVITALAIQVGDVGVEIPSQLARRLATRVFRGETYEEVVKREVIRGLEVFAGMRPA